MGIEQFGGDMEWAAKNKEKPDDYDLKKELGNKNEYDQIVGEAYRVGFELSDSRLIDMSAELGELIRTIPYNHDNFYKVIAKAHTVQRYIKEIIDINEKSDSDSTFYIEFGEGGAESLRFDFRLSVNEDNRKRVPSIILGTIHTFGDQEEYVKLTDEIADYMLEELSINKQKLFESVESYQGNYHETTDSVYYTDEKDPSGSEVYEIWDHKHQDGAIGYRYIFFVSEPEVANSLWAKLQEKYGHEA